MEIYIILGLTAFVVLVWFWTSSNRMEKQIQEQEQRVREEREKLRREQRREREDEKLRKELLDEEGHIRPFKVSTFERLAEYGEKLSRVLKYATSAELNIQFDTLSEEEIEKEERRKVDMHFFTEIAGAVYHCTEEMTFRGVVLHSPDNEYDHNAMAVMALTPELKFLGYIPAKELRKYIKWCDRRPFPCVGYIKENSLGDMTGRVFVIRPYSIEQVEKEAADFLEAYT